MQRFALVAAAFNTAHVGVLDAQNVVVEIIDGLLAIGRLNVGGIFAIVRLANLGSAHLVGDGAATVHDDSEGTGAGGVSTACISGFQHVLTV